MKLYIIGPVTGFDDLNYPAFTEARKKLEADGYQVLIPHDFVASDATWQQAMRRSLETLVKSDGIACLHGWSKSHGASHEVETAQWLGMPVMNVEDWINPYTAFKAVDESKTLKLCQRCKRIIPQTLFNRSASTFDGRQAYCRDCMAAYKHGKRIENEPA